MLRCFPSNLRVSLWKQSKFMSLKHMHHTHHILITRLARQSLECWEKSSLDPKASWLPPSCLIFYMQHCSPHSGIEGLFLLGVYFIPVRSFQTYIYIYNWACFSNPSSLIVLLHSIHTASLLWLFLFSSWMYWRESYRLAASVTKSSYFTLVVPSMVSCYYCLACCFHFSESGCFFTYGTPKPNKENKF